MGEEAFLGEVAQDVAHDGVGDGVVGEGVDGGREALAVGALPVAGGLDAEGREEEGGGDEGGEHRHEDGDAQDLDVAVGGGDAGDDQGHLAARHHAQAHAQGAHGGKPEEQGGQAAADDLGQDGDGGVDEAGEEDALLGELGDVDHHAHDDEEDRDEELVNAVEFLLDHHAHVRAREGEARDVGADDHRQAGLLEEPAHQERHAQGEDGHLAVRAAEAQEPGHAPRDEDAHHRRAQPDTEAFGGDAEDAGP